MSQAPRAIPAADAAELRDAVRGYYTERLTTGCCDPSGPNVVFESAPDVPSFGCGDPNAAASFRAGETVLDLGSGAGFDALRAAEAVGPTGSVIGVDMTPAMLEAARAVAERLALRHVRFVEGTIEALPLEDACVDVVISNCVVNLSADVPRVLGEAHRALRAGGRLRISDTFRFGAAPAELDRDAWCACEAGAHQANQFSAQARAAGFVDVRVDPAPPGLADGAIYGAVLHGTKPAISVEADPAEGAELIEAAGLPLAGWDAANVVRWGVREAGVLLGVVALERHGDYGLLRSLAVAPEARGRGLAHALVAHALRASFALGLRDVAGLTTTIPDLLPRWGFREVARDALPVALTASPELQGACPTSARAFVRTVTA
ncbi:MAG: GNAT family N-acetyltransferase [Trueperaceae bacterium]